MLRARRRMIFILVCLVAVVLKYSYLLLFEIEFASVVSQDLKCGKTWSVALLWVSSILYSPQSHNYYKIYMKVCNIMHPCYQVQILKHAWHMGINIIVVTWTLHLTCIHTGQTNISLFISLTAAVAIKSVAIVIVATLMQITWLCIIVANEFRGLVQSPCRKINVIMTLKFYPS